MVRKSLALSACESLLLVGGGWGNTMVDISEELRAENKIAAQSNTWRRQVGQLREG